MMNRSQASHGGGVVGVVPDLPSHFSIDSDLADQLLKLSFKDRVAIQEETHGVRCLAVQETSELIEEKLGEFDAQIMKEKSKIDRELMKQYQDSNTARTKNILRNVESISDDPIETKSISDPLPLSSPSPNETLSATIVNTEKRNHGCYLNDPNVRLRFLRCECFDVAKAVQRLVHFLEFASELFGDYVGDRPIRITDFNTRREEVALQNSRNQFLPFRDRAGRRVFASVSHCDFVLSPIELRWKIMLYLFWAASENIETQQKGVVMVAWIFNEDSTSWERDIRPNMDIRQRYFYTKFSKSLPLRISGNQSYWKDTPFFRSVSALFYFGMESHMKAMYKAHFGEPTELRYSLMSYGIPEQLLPISNTGTVKTLNHSRRINALRAKAKREELGLTNDLNDGKTEEEEEIVDCPGSRDVIFRKGSTHKNNPGNMYFRELIESTQYKHAQGSRKVKYKITCDVIDETLAQNGRFLDWCSDKEMWVVAKDREKIRKKVAACYKQFNRNAQTFQQQLQRRQAKSLSPSNTNQRVKTPSPTNTCQDNCGARRAAPAITVSNETATSSKYIEKVDRLREYFDVTFPSTKRQRMLFSNSDDSSGCGRCDLDPSECGYAGI